MKKYYGILFVCFCFFLIIAFWLNLITGSFFIYLLIYFANNDL